MAGRTQAERRAETIDALLMATLRSLEEVGYARTTTDEICQRAGVSQGALFHHFQSRSELISAAIRRHEEVLLERVRRAAEAVDADGWPSDDPVDFLTDFIEQVRHPRNIALFEALLGARGDEQVRDDLRRTVEHLYEAARTLICRHPAFVGLDDRVLDRWIGLLRDFIAGESIWRAAGVVQAHERERLDALVHLARRLAA